jgi:hypothetical protein
MAAIVFGIVIAIMDWPTVTGFIHFPVAASGRGLCQTPTKTDLFFSTLEE